MRRRTTLEIDDDLLARAREALGCTSMRETVEEALRRAAQQAEDAATERGRRQLAYLEQLSERVDIEVLSSDRMWR